ncbi:MAG: oligosaccharide flippase family protein [Patescibacteria group bacterium]|nr:oligosaccharide flippase family protein [Patescibacteria group bacterium]
MDFQFGRKSILILISEIIIRLLHAMTFFLAVNSFSPIFFGYQKVALSLMALFIFISTLGFLQAHNIIMAEKGNQDDAFTIYFLIKVILTIIASIITFIIILNLINDKNFSYFNTEQIWVIIIIFFELFLDSFNQIYTRSFLSKMEIAKMQIPIIISTIIGKFFSIAVIFIFQNFYIYLIGTIITYSIKLIFSIYLGRIFHFSKINRKLLKRYIYLSIIFLLPVILDTLSTNLGPLFFLQYFDEEALGVYFVIFTFFTMIVTLQKTFQILLIPNFINLLTNNDVENLKKSIRLFGKYMTIMNSLIIVTGIIFGEFFLKNFFGIIYYEQGLYFYYGCLLFTMRFALLDPYSSVLIASNQLKLFTFLKTLNFVSALVSWIFFIPIFGIIGIELGNWIFLIPNIIIIRIYSHKKNGIGNIDIKELMHYSVSVILFIICFFITSLNLGLLLSGLILLIIVGLYVMFLFKAKLFTRKDIEYIFDIINPKKMINYIRDETKKETEKEK